MKKADIGLIGLAVMGENLVMNMESKGFTVAVFNRTAEKVDKFVNGRAAGKNIIGFNEPCDHFPVMTHEVKLTEMTREANKRFFSSIDEVPTAAITMGIGTVMAARKIVMIITGADKAEILHKVFFGPVTPEVPGSILQFHHDVTLICDEAATAKMPQEGQQCSI